MAEPSIWPGASGKFTRRKLGEKLYLPSSDFNLRDPNCYSFRPAYHSLHDPHLKQHLHRKDIHHNLKERNFITDDDMVICTQKEYSKYHDYVEDIKNDFITRQLRERQRKLLELREQGLISEDMSLEDIRTFLLTNKLPRCEEHQQPELRHPKKSTKKTRKKKDVPQKSTKKSRKKKDVPQNGQFQNERIQPICTYDRQQLHLIEQEIKHEFNRNKYLKEIQEKRSRRKKIILDRRAVVEQAETDKLLKILRNLDKMRVIKEEQTKFLNHIVCESTSDIPLLQPMQRRHTLTRLAPLQARGHVWSNQKTSSSDTTSILASNTARPKSPHLGKLKLPSIQRDSVSLCSVANIKDEEAGFVLLPEVGDSAPEIDSLADASADLSDATSSLSNLEVFKCERSPPVISQENEASTPVICAEEVEMLAYASTALSTASVSPCSVTDTKYEGPEFVLLPVAGLSAPEISSNEIDSLADASADLSGATSSLRSLQVFKTEDHQPVISQENEVSTPEISAEEVEMLAYASTAPSTASVSLWSVTDVKDEEAGLVPLPIVGLSAPEISSNEIDSPANASADLSGATSSLSQSLRVFKSEGSQPVPSQEVTLEISSDKLETRLDASSTSCLAPSFPSAATGAPTCSGTSQTNNITTQEMVGQWISLSKLNFVSICLATTVIDSVYHSDSPPNPSSNASPELEANSPSSEVTPSKPESPCSKRSFRARKWLSSSALERSANINPDTAVHSKSVGCLTRTDMESMDEDQPESPSSGSMSFSDARLEEKRSLVCSPLPNRLRSSNTLTNVRSSMLQPKPPCKKSNHQLTDETTKTLGKRRVKIYTVFRNPEGPSDDELSSTSCSVPEESQSGDEEEEEPEEDPSPEEEPEEDSSPEEDQSCSLFRRHSI